jgi:hypothetical protein
MRLVCILWKENMGCERYLNELVTVDRKEAYIWFRSGRVGDESLCLLDASRERAKFCEKRVMQLVLMSWCKERTVL